MDWKGANEWLGVAAGIVGSVTVLVPAARSAVWRVLKGAVFLVRAPFIILEEVKANREEVQGNTATLEDVQRRLVNVEHEVQDNSGGSIKDHTKRMESRHRAEFWQKGRPAMELHPNGAVILVSEALCRLVGVRDRDLVHGKNWLRFVNSAEVETFLETLSEMGEEMTLFRFEVELFNDHKGTCGRWEFNANVVDPPIAGKRLLSGHWTPADEIAREIAGRNNWAN